MIFPQKIYEKLKNLPMSPGVYLMKNGDGKVIYVGKSKVLKNRVSQYFQNSASHSPKTLAMVSKIDDFDYVLTDTEAEALALECNLIKKYHPQYNILLKDDKQYPYIKITANEDFPRIMMTRKILRDGALYFGPYMSGFAVKDTLDVIKNIFQIRSCKKVLPRDIGKGRPCLLYHLKQCSAPCANMISKAEYREVFDKIEEVLKGNVDGVLAELTEKMYKASADMEYEKAGVFRDKIESIKSLTQRQKISTTKADNRDVIGIYNSDSESCIQIFYIRDGKTVGTEHFIFESKDGTTGETIEAFIKQFYYTSTSIPGEIVIPENFDELEDVENWLSQNCGHRVHITVPKRGEKSRFLKLVNKNAEESYKVYRFKRDKEQSYGNKILASLRGILNLEKIPYRIECYDISNISGAESVGAEIVYENAKPCRKHYRKFNIKTVDGANDYASMQEVICRRFKEAYKEVEMLETGELEKGKEKFLPLPDLILLDGGRGHVTAIKEVLDLFEEKVPLYGLVKDDKHRTRALTNETREIALDKDSELFKFLFGMQEEVHRFAITAFRKKHRKSATASELEKIRGVGSEKRKKLLQYYGSARNIRNASLNELEIILDKKTASAVYEYFNK